MTTLSTFLSIALIHALGVLSPGPDFAIIMRQSLRFGWRVAVISAVGIGAGILVHVAATLFGLTALLAVAPWALTVIQILGALVLAWIGWQGLHATPTEIDDEQALPSRRQAFLVGLATNALNVKALMFFAALFSTLLVGEVATWWLKASLMVYLPLATALLFALIAVLIGNPWMRARVQRYGHWLDRVMGAVLLLLSIYVLQAALFR